MVEFLTSSESIRLASRRIGQLINEREEWFLSRTDVDSSSYVRRSEIHVRPTERRLVLSCLTDQGLRRWRIRSWEWSQGKLILGAKTVKGNAPILLELVPRVSARVATELVSEIRRVRCQRLAQLTNRIHTGMRIVRMGLSPGIRRGEPGRYARILLESRRECVAVTGTVTTGEAGSVDAFLSAALIWFHRTRARTNRPSITNLWLVVYKENAEPLSQRIALLTCDLRRLITVFQVDEELNELVPLGRIEKEDLFSQALAKLRRPQSIQVTEASRQIVAMAPDAIDVVRARHGETLRFHGLPFARVRRVMNSERVWFGVDLASRRILDEHSFAELEMLLKELEENRNAATPHRRHAFYRAAPEAWLESLLRRDISKLDPGLRLAPIHTQFRTAPASSGSARPVDLLALRHDGRLAVIELKVTEDREHVLQGVDYWRRVEAHRRCGNIQRARLFDDAVIADEPPLVYLAAPLLSFHRAFYTLANSIAPEIKIYRFELNEDWRRGVRVTRRCDFR